MKIHVLGGGMYGCHISIALLEYGHDVTLYEKSDKLFSGASGNIPARLHLGFHYSRSKMTRDACQNNFDIFMNRYGDFTRAVACNIYAVANDSYMDYGTYSQLMRSEIDCIRIDRPGDYGLTNCEGALLTAERHILVDQLRDYFMNKLKNLTTFNAQINEVFQKDCDVTIDATFCSNENDGVDRYELCHTVLLEGPISHAVTIVDGAYPSLYPWDESRGLSSLTSALHTPIHRSSDWASADQRMRSIGSARLAGLARDMFGQMMMYWPGIEHEYKIKESRLAIRAMPRSHSDARLIDVRRIGERCLRIRAGKIDAVFSAEQKIIEMLEEFK